jgi:ParB-like chromosome segregation protein Spo0J
MAAIISLGRLIITYLALTALILDPRNPRRHSARQIQQIAQSIKAFGFAVPILVDCHNRIIAGYGRFLASQFLGLTEVPVIRLEHLSATQAKAFMIADNRLTESSVWDDQLLAEALKELSELELDFNIETTGFTMGEIDLQIEGLSAPSNDSPDLADQLPAPTSQLPISKLGDLYRACCWNCIQVRDRVVCSSARTRMAITK